MQYAQVVINNNNDNTDAIYTYEFSEPSITIGDKVFVPFGNGNRLIEGYVFSVSDTAPIDTYRIKEIHSKAEDRVTLTEEMIDVCQWMKKKYFCRYIDAVQCFIPTGSSAKKTDKVHLNDIDYSSANGTDQKVIALLREKNDLSSDQICDELGENVRKRLTVLKNNKVITIYHEFKRKVNTKYEEKVKIINENLALQYIKNLKNAPKQKLLLELLLDIKEGSLSYLYNNYGIDSSVVRTLVKKGLLVTEKIEIGRIPANHITGEKSLINHLTPEQTTALNQMFPYLYNRQHKIFLLHGVTGSGKTEVYMQLIDKAVEQNRTTLILVPEISLTMQMIERFKGRFGNHSIAILHSKLSLGERYDEWVRIRRGEVKIVIGARSAVFAPLSNIGVIIVDEEHETSYKSENTPKYDAIEIAQKRAEIQGSLLILGSATPSVTSSYRAQMGEYEKIRLTKRYNETPLPYVEIVDMREELKNGNKSIFSVKLFNNMKECLKTGKQVILFLNRRGYSTFVSCRNCGYVVKCPECGISLTYHSRKDAVMCHFCGYEMKAPRKCPECESKYIKYFGVGTEKVEEVTKQLFPEFQVERLDLDTAKRKGSTENILSNFKKEKTQILIGTQIVAKGLDFKNVGLVGIVAADISLNIPDYRSPERTFQLITQAAGRAGRGDKRGKVIIQSYNPQNYAIVASSTHNYEAFYQNELLLREQIHYPPFSHLIQLSISSTDEAAVVEAAKKTAEYFIAEAGDSAEDDVMGPQPAPIYKINGKYRYQIVIKCRPIDQEKYLSIINNIKLKYNHSEFGACGLSIDCNPYSFM